MCCEFSSRGFGDVVRKCCGLGLVLGRCDIILVAVLRRMPALDLPSPFHQCAHGKIREARVPSPSFFSFFPLALEVISGILAF
ncbi:hypothetical protein COCNU_07G000220 [Cocos nucifera]|uniref:Uncharacterized protein n=1 Tax=Cocos nucifera TaxID=13894 RepID=A0A8K0IDH1_COCNU|nr:hypothetical protein COCNU_07G000220 [Cocos nucifera]